MLEYDDTTTQTELRAQESKRNVRPGSGRGRCHTKHKTVFGATLTFHLALDTPAGTTAWVPFTYVRTTTATDPTRSHNGSTDHRSHTHHTTRDSSSYPKSNACLYAQSTTTAAEPTACWRNNTYAQRTSVCVSKTKTCFCFRTRREKLVGSRGQGQGSFFHRNHAYFTVSYRFMCSSNRYQQLKRFVLIRPVLRVCMALFRAAINRCSDSSAVYWYTVQYMWSLYSLTPQLKPLTIL